MRRQKSRDSADFLKKRASENPSAEVSFGKYERLIGSMIWFCAEKLHYFGEPNLLLALVT
jgi:hypothetical protein